MPAPLHSTSQYLPLVVPPPLWMVETVNLAPVSDSAKTIAVLACNVGSVQIYLDFPFASAMKMTSWSCILEAADTILPTVVQNRFFAEHYKGKGTYHSSTHASEFTISMISKAFWDARSSILTFFSIPPAAPNSRPVDVFATIVRPTPWYRKQP